MQITAAEAVKLHLDCPMRKDVPSHLSGVEGPLNTQVMHCTATASARNKTSNAAKLAQQIQVKSITTKQRNVPHW